MRSEGAVSLQDAPRGDRSDDYQKLLQSIYDAVLVTDAAGRILDHNSRATEFFFGGKGDLLGKNVVDLLSGATDTLLNEIQQNFKEHKFTLIDASCVRYDGSTFPAEVAVNRIDVDMEGELCFFVRDVSIRKRAQEALEDAVERLEEHDRARSQFVSNVSHELRTPLTSMIYAVTNMLRGVVGTLPDPVRRYLKILEGDCRRLLGTVNDILDLRKIESKSLTLARSRVPFSRLVRRSVESLRVQAEQKSLTVNVSSAHRHVFVNCDVQKMERVILNVVGNAIKFTPEGGEVSVVSSNDSQKPEHVLLSVEDTGVGIPPKAIPRVTERYFTVGKQPSGSGLGLAMSREIVELHDGTIVIKSPPAGAEGGTGVYISMPDTEPPVVLVVDDDQSVRDVLARQLSEQGYRVMASDNGVDALEQVEKSNPDIVVLDLALPGMEGSEVILKMRSSANTSHVPIIVVTGAHVGRAKAQILNSFAIPALSKPWQESELLDRIEGAFLGAAALRG